MQKTIEVVWFERGAAMADVDALTEHFAIVRHLQAAKESACIIL